MSNFDNIGGIYAKDTELRQDIDDVKQLLGYEEEYAPQTKSRSANDTQYFTGIDVVSAGSTTLSADVIDSDARIQISDIADFVGYLSYLDGVTYNVNGINPVLENGRFWGKWENKKGLRPVDNAGNYIKVDWSQDWELGYAVLMKNEIIRTERTISHGRESGSGFTFKAPVGFVAHSAYASDPYATFGLRVSATTLTIEDLWEANTGFSEGMLPDTWYFIKASYNATTHTASITATKDFINWSTAGSVAKADKTPYTGDDDYMCFAGQYPESNDGAQNVILDLANTYIKQNGIMIWGHYDGAFAGENHYVNPSMPWRPLNDGYSNFWFELTDDTLSPWLNFSAKNANAVIDWGDGSGEVALDTLTPTHTYSKAGKYVVKVKGVTGIARQITENNAVYSNALQGAELNNEISSIRDYGFWECIGLKNVAFLGSNLNIGIYAFASCGSLHNVVLPKNLTEIPITMFYKCISLSTVNIPITVTAIYISAFREISLRKIILPANITSLGDYTFMDCELLSEIHCQATTPPTVGISVFRNNPTNYIIYVPTGTADTYKAASGWSTYADHILEEGQTPTRAMLAKFNADEPQDDMR